jgi:hypothetical protein
MKIQKLKIYKRSLSSGRRTMGNFVIGAWNVKSPFQKPISRQGNQTVIHSPIHSPFQRTSESIKREQQRKAEHEAKKKAELHELRMRSNMEREKARIEESKYRQRRAKHASRQSNLTKGTTRRSRTSYSGRQPSYEQQMEARGYRYNVASGTWEKRPTGRYNVASGLYE